MIGRANAAARAANKENMVAVLELEAQVQRLNEELIWARVREEETRRMQAEEARHILQEQVEDQRRKLLARSLKVAKERQVELAGLRFRCKEYAEKFDVEPLAAENEELEGEIQQLHDEITELKGITEPDKDYFHRDGFTIRCRPRHRGGHHNGACVAQP
eukprot:4176756-Pleurochrysis_carterae.AAC.1